MVFARSLYTKSNIKPPTGQPPPPFAPDMHSPALHYVHVLIIVYNRVISKYNFCRYEVRILKCQAVIAKAQVD